MAVFRWSSLECVEISENPYQIGRTVDESPANALTRVQATVLVLLAIMLIARGGLMLLSWEYQLRTGWYVVSLFFAAILLKDSIYGVTALVGGGFLLFRERIGWWLSMAHWCWYLATEVVLVGVAASLGWRFPIHQEAPIVGMSVTILLALAGLAILLWQPIMLACRGPVEQRKLTIFVSLLVSLLIAFGVNGWMSLLYGSSW